jgi:hypothetical protein
MNDCYFEKKDWRECKQEVRFSDLIFWRTSRAEGFKGQYDS